MPNDSEALQRLLQADTQAESGGASMAAPFYVPGLTVLYHPDAERIGERVALAGLASGRAEDLARGEPAFAQPGSALLRPLADPYLSRRPLRLLPAGEPGGVRLSRGESGTAVMVDGEPVREDLEIPPDRLKRVAVLLLAGRVVLLLSRLDPVGVAGASDFGLVGESAPMLALRREIQRVAGLDVPVLLRGETGTGKELIARALHDAGRRRERPYLAVNMAAVPATLAAAELFGAARGAYTGADRRREGHFQRADGGTLFLDEVGETPLEVQALLLRALETHEIQPVGSDDVRRVDVRLGAPTGAWRRSPRTSCWRPCGPTAGASSGPPRRSASPGAPFTIESKKASTSGRPRTCLARRSRPARRLVEVTSTPWSRRWRSPSGGSSAG